MARKRFTFWLDDTKEQEYQLIGEVGQLKKERSFSQTIRDGIRLIQNLREGKLEVLFELFPFVRAEFLEYMKDIKSDNGDSGGDDIKQQIARLEQLILAQNNKPDTPIMKQNGGLKPLSNGNGGLQQIGGLKPLAAPKFDDDDNLLVVENIKSDGTATQRFLASFAALNDYSDKQKDTR